MTHIDLADRDRRAARVIVRTPERQRDYPTLLRWARATLGIPTPARGAAASQRGTGEQGGGDL